MQQRTKDRIAAMDFLGQLAKAAHTGPEHRAVRQLHREIRDTHRRNGDVGLILRRYGLRVPKAEPVLEVRSYFVDDLVRAILGTDGNGNGWH